jgi:O-antigen/teichoic acid export membrane protein
MGSVWLLLNMTDHEAVVTKTLVWAVIFNIAMNLFLIPIWGMNGAATATAATYVIWNIFLTRAVSSRLEINSTVFGREAGAS